MKKTLFLALILVLAPAPAFADWHTTVDQVRANIEQTALGPHSITIDYRNGDVILTGQVASVEDMRRAEIAARAARGVREVTNQLSVSPQAPAAYSSSPTLNSIYSALKADPSLGGYEIVLSGRGGTVVLTGLVDNAADRMRIEELARLTPGVLQVQNELAIKAPPADAELALRVRDALSAEPGIHAADIQVRADNGVVTLAGSQPSFRDVDRILSVAMTVNGVRDLNNEISIGGRPYMQAYAPRYEQQRARMERAETE